MPPGTKEILQNKEIIAVSQDPLGKMGYPIYTNTSQVRVWIKELSPNGCKARWAVVLQNFLTESTILKVDPSKIPGWNLHTRLQPLPRMLIASNDFVLEPYDEVFDVLKGDEPIDDEEEEINSDEEGPTTLQERRTPPLPNDGEDSVSTPHSGRGGLEAYDRSSHRFHVDASSGLTELGSINSSPQSLASNSARGLTPQGAAQHRHLAVPIMEHNRSSDGSSVASSSGYQAEDFAHLSVSEEIKDLFGYISRYHPHTVELETPLKPFIPELIPAVGEVDAALKIPPPSTGLKECMSADKTILNGLGLVELDEPCLNQSDPAVVQL
ncbi:hypothetical protein Pmar_PMAR010332, partial [Perkinsus marinus ATCC 50983]